MAFEINLFFFLQISGNFNEKGTNRRWNLVFGHEMRQSNAAEDNSYSNGPGS